MKSWCEESLKKKVDFLLMRHQITLSDMSPTVNRRFQQTAEVLKSLGNERGHCCPRGGMCAHVSMRMFFITG